MPDKLLGPWLTCLAAAAMGSPLHGVLVGRNAVVRMAPLPQDAALAQLQAVLQVFAEGMRWPLPLPPCIRPALPRNATGKLNKGELRRIDRARSGQE